MTNSNYPTTLTTDSNQLQILLENKINPMLGLNHNTNYGLDFGASSYYPRNKTLRTFNLTGRLKANGFYYFIHNFTNLTDEELSTAIDLFYDNCEEAIREDKDNYLKLALNKGYNPNRNVDWKISIMITPNKVSNNDNDN